MLARGPARPGPAGRRRHVAEARRGKAGREEGEKRRRREGEKEEAGSG